MQIVWKHVGDPCTTPLAWSRYTWRRGSVPLHWGVNIRNGGMGDAEIHIRKHGTFKGSRRYVRRLQNRYVPNPDREPDPVPLKPGEDASLAVPVVFMSLLRKGAIDRDK